MAFIKVDESINTATYASELLRFKEYVRQAYHQGLYVRGVMAAQEEVWANVELLFGLASGQGSNVWDLVNGTIGAMEGTFQNSNGRDITTGLGAGKNT